MGAEIASPFRRHEHNPVLSRTDLTNDGILVFNPGVARVDDRLLMAYRCDHGTWGDPNITGTEIRFAWSPDGVSWRDDPALALDRAAAVKLLQPLEPHRDLERELWRIYDPRLVVLDDHAAGLALTFAADTTHGLRAGLAESVDGTSWTAVSLGPPDNRNQVLFPRPVAGRWVRLERPMHGYGGQAMGADRHGIWISHSPDRRHWGDTRFLFDHTVFPYANDKVGPGPPPIATAAGWLCIIHTVANDPSAAKRGWEPTWQRTYHASAVLLDLEDPSRIIAASPQPLLAPDPAYRYESEGYRNDVIFPGGTLVTDGEDGLELWMYYGAADTSIALATASMSDVIDFVLSGRLDL